MTAPDRSGPDPDTVATGFVKPHAPIALVSVLVPVYNEHVHIANVIRRILAAPMPPGVDRELVIVDDGSTDGTGDRLDEFRARADIQIHHTVDNRGKGFAIRSALEFARGDVIVIHDGDTEYNPIELTKLVEPIVAGRAVVVYGSRFQGAAVGMRLPYRVVNKLLVAAVRILYGLKITDEATAYKAFRRDVLTRMGLRCRRFEFCPEVTSKAARLGLPIHEVPITYRARSVAEGKKIRLSDAVEAFVTLARYRFWRPR
jgi:glycosyltransferase involved in cell wall biosynthesis